MIKLVDQQIHDRSYKFYKDDLLRIQKALFIYRGLFLPLDECGNVWQSYSWALSASWLFVPDNLGAIVGNIESADSFKSYEDWSSLE